MVIAGYEERKRQAIVDFAEERITYDAMMAVFYESYGCTDFPNRDTPPHMLASWSEGRANARADANYTIDAYYEQRCVPDKSRGDLAVLLIALVLMTLLLLFAPLA